MKNRIAIVFFTHRFGDEESRRFNALLKVCNDPFCKGFRASPFILAQNGTPIPDSLHALTHLFDFEKIKSRARKVITGKIIPGSPHLAALDFYSHHPGFDYYWFIEYDIVFNGDWKYFFECMTSDKADLLASHIRSIRHDPLWEWWKHSRIPVSEENRLAAFFPIYRISNRGLMELGRKVDQGWWGHFEVLIPTAIKAASLTISDIGGDGPFTPIHRANRFYIGQFKTKFKIGLGTHRYRPTHSLPLLVRNFIYHPVKKADPRQRHPLIQIVLAFARHPGSMSVHLWMTVAGFFRGIFERH